MKVKVIPTGVHGMLDYLASGVNLAFPRLLGLQDAPWAATVPRLDGLAGLGYSLITDYELGAFRALPWRRTWRSTPRRASSWRHHRGSSASRRTAPATGCRTS
jgi:hypothetical protein